MNVGADPFRVRVGRGPALLLDAALGTELERRGIASGLPLWSARALLESPAAVLDIHGENVQAGADVLTANTFRTHRRSLEKAGLGERASELTARAVDLARQAASRSPRDVFVVGSLSPLEDCYRPDLTPPVDDLEREHREQARALAAAGVDGILLETHNSVVELARAARAAVETGLPVLASFVTDGGAYLLSGDSISLAVDTLLACGVDAIGINCVPGRLLAHDLDRVAQAAPGMPLVAYGNTTRFAGEVTPEKYVGFARDWLALGARLLGGCCGTTAAHTAALRRLLDTGDA